MVKWENDTRFGIIVGKHCAVGPFRLAVHKNIFSNPVTWYASADPDLFSCQALASRDIDQAGCQALAKLQVVMQDAINEITGEE